MIGQHARIQALFAGVRASTGEDVRDTLEQ